MFKIDQHIEFLLLNHSCVIVPGFGGFVVHRVPARLDDSDGMMLPPTTTVGFNPQLVINDSLLIQSFVEAYDMSYPEAQREVEHETQELRGLIADNGRFDIHSVGIITINAEGNYEFEPCQAGILVPRLYGLSGIETQEAGTFLAIKKAQPQPAAVAPVAEVSEEKEDVVVIDEEEDVDEDTINIRRSTIYKVAAACAAVLLLVAIPFISTGGDTHKMLSGIDFSFITSLMPKTEVQQAEISAKKEPYHVYVYKKAEQKADKAVTAESTETEAFKSEPSAEEHAKKTIAEEQDTPSYTIVLAAQVSKRNAEIYVNDLKAMNFKDVRMIGEGKDRKVVMGSYKTEEEAKQVRRSIASKADFSSAWVMKMK